MSGKEIMLDYCKNVVSHSIYHLESCQDVERGLINNNYIDLDGHCPSSYGLDKYVGECETNDNEFDGYMCQRCWENAIKLEIIK